MPTILVSSSAIRALAYEPTTQNLVVEFVRASARYIYLRVSPEVFTEFATASSKGQFFNRNIRDRYSFVRG